MKGIFRNATAVLGIVGISIGLIYWFDLDDVMVAKMTPTLKKVAALRKASEYAARDQAQAAAKAAAAAPETMV